MKRWSGYYERTQEEIRRDIDLLYAERDCLAKKPQPRRHLATDHAFQPATLQCSRCGVSAAAFYRTERGLPCRSGRP